MGCTMDTAPSFLGFMPLLSHTFFYSRIKNNSGCYDGCDSRFLLFLVEPSSDLYLLFSHFSPGRLPVVSLPHPLASALAVLLLKFLGGLLSVRVGKEVICSWQHGPTLISKIKRHINWPLLKLWELAILSMNSSEKHVLSAGAWAVPVISEVLITFFSLS